MSEQRIDTGAEAATSTDADPGEGQGLNNASAHPGAAHDPRAGGGSGDPGAGRLPDPDAPAPHEDEGATEGKRSVQRAMDPAAWEPPPE